MQIKIEQILEENPEIQMVKLDNQNKLVNLGGRYLPF